MRKYEVVEPHFIPEGFVVNSIITVRDKYFRIANIVESFVQMDGHNGQGQDRESSSAASVVARCRNNKLTNTTRLL